MTAPAGGSGQDRKGIVEMGTDEEIRERLSCGALGPFAAAGVIADGLAPGTAMLAGADLRVICEVALRTDWLFIVFSPWASGPQPLGGRALAEVRTMLRAYLTRPIDGDLETELPLRRATSDLAIRLLRAAEGKGTS